MQETKFLICKTCGNIVGVIEDGSVPMVCCGKPMEELKANTTDAVVEKHVPVVTVNGQEINVTVGSVEHPMTEQHLITWIYLQTEKGGQRKALSAVDAPKAKFLVTEDDKPLAVYAYCNLHGLWKAEL